MEKKTAGIVALVFTILCCGLPGLCGLCAGPIYIIAGSVPGAEIDIFGSNDPSAAIIYGIGTICLSVLFVAIPVVVGFLTLRKKSQTPEDNYLSDSQTF